MTNPPDGLVERIRDVTLGLSGFRLTEDEARAAIRATLEWFGRHGVSPEAANAMFDHMADNGPIVTTDERIGCVMVLFRAAAEELK